MPKSVMTDNSLSRYWAWILDLKERKIRVNAISPGPINTPGLDGSVQTEGVGEQLKASLLASVALGRFRTPDEIAKAAVFLASDDSSFVACTELFVDGGAAQNLSLDAVTPPAGHQ